MLIVYSPLSAQDQTENLTEQFEPSEEVQKMDEETQNWLFALGSAVAAAIGIVIVSISQGKTAHN